MSDVTHPAAGRPGVTPHSPSQRLSSEGVLVRVRTYGFGRCFTRPPATSTRNHPCETTTSKPGWVPFGQHPERAIWRNRRQCPGTQPRAALPKRSCYPAGPRAPRLAPHASSEIFSLGPPRGMATPVIMHPRQGKPCPNYLPDELSPADVMAANRC
jgi:hypothetical protein